MCRGLVERIEDVPQGLELGRPGRGPGGQGGSRRVGGLGGGRWAGVELPSAVRRLTGNRTRSALLHERGRGVAPASPSLMPWTGYSSRVRLGWGLEGGRGVWRRRDWHPLPAQLQPLRGTGQRRRGLAVSPSQGQRRGPNTEQGGRLTLDGRVRPKQPASAPPAASRSRQPAATRGRSPKHPIPPPHSRPASHSRTLAPSFPPPSTLRSLLEARQNLLGRVPLQLCSSPSSTSPPPRPLRLLSCSPPSSSPALHLPPRLRLAHPPSAR